MSPQNKGRSPGAKTPRQEDLNATIESEDSSGSIEVTDLTTERQGRGPMRLEGGQNIQAVHSAPKPSVRRLAQRTLHQYGSADARLFHGVDDRRHVLRQQRDGGLGTGLAAGLEAEVQRGDVRRSRDLAVAGDGDGHGCLSGRLNVHVLAGEVESAADGHDEDWEPHRGTEVDGLVSHKSKRGK